MSKNLREQLTEDKINKFRETTIDIYDLDEYIKKGHPGWLPHVWHNVAIILTDGKNGLMLDYEAIGVSFRDVTEDIILDLSKEPVEQIKPDGSKVRSFSVFPEARLKTCAENIMKGAPKHQEKAGEFFKKCFGYNQRCESNMRESLEWLDKHGFFDEKDYFESLNEEWQQCSDEAFAALEKELANIGFKVNYFRDENRFGDIPNRHYQIISEEGNQTPETFDKLANAIADILDTFEDMTGCPTTFNAGLQYDGFISCGFDVEGAYYEPGKDTKWVKPTKWSFRNGKPADKETIKDMEDTAKHLGMDADDLSNFIPVDKKNESLNNSNMNEVWTNGSGPGFYEPIDHVYKDLEDQDIYYEEFDDVDNNEIIFEVDEENSQAAQEIILKWCGDYRLEGPDKQDKYSIIVSRNKLYIESLDEEYITGVGYVHTVEECDEMINELVSKRENTKDSWLKSEYLKRINKLMKVKHKLKAEEKGEFVTTNKLYSDLFKIAGLEKLRTRTTAIRGYRPVSGGHIEIQDVNGEYYLIYFYRKENKIPEVIEGLKKLGYIIKGAHDSQIWVMNYIDKPDFFESVDPDLEEDIIVKPGSTTINQVYKEFDTKQEAIDYIISEDGYGEMSIRYIPKTNKYRVVWEEIDESLEEDIEKHDELNPKLFDGEELKPEVKETVEKIAKEFIDGLHEDGIAFDLRDIVLIGSNVSYNYTKDSDLDLHLIADPDALECPENLVDKLYSAYRAIFNRDYDITIKDIPVEIFVELGSPNAKSNGMYSINTGWIKKPVQQDIPDLDEEAFEKLFTEWEDKYFDLIGDESLREDFQKLNETEYLKDVEEGLADDWNKYSKYIDTFEYGGRPRYVITYPDGTTSKTSFTSKKEVIRLLKNFFEKNPNIEDDDSYSLKPFKLNIEDFEKYFLPINEIGEFTRCDKYIGDNLNAAIFLGNGMYRGDNQIITIYKNSATSSPRPGLKVVAEYDINNNVFTPTIYYTATKNKYISSLPSLKDLRNANVSDYFESLKEDIHPNIDLGWMGKGRRHPVDADTYTTKKKGDIIKVAMPGNADDLELQVQDGSYLDKEARDSSGIARDVAAEYKAINAYVVQAQLLADIERKVKKAIEDTLTDDDFAYYCGSWTGSGIPTDPKLVLKGDRTPIEDKETASDYFENLDLTGKKLQEKFDLTRIQAGNDNIEKFPEEIKNLFINNKEFSRWFDVVDKYYGQPSSSLIYLDQNKAVNAFYVAFITGNIREVTVNEEITKKIIEELKPYDSISDYDVFNKQHGEDQQFYSFIVSVSKKITDNIEMFFIAWGKSACMSIGFRYIPDSETIDYFEDLSK